MARIEIEGLGKVYPGGTRAVGDVSIDIADGELIVLVGPSGCGKSTLLRMVAGLESITEGTVRIGERVVNDLEPADRDIAMVFQNYALYPHMSVRANMEYGLKNRGTPRPEQDQPGQVSPMAMGAMDHNAAGSGMPGMAAIAPAAVAGV